MQLKRYSALVKDGNRAKIIANKEYKIKLDFIKDLREAGYKVAPKRVKKADLFEYITRYTVPWDWELKEIPKEQREDK